MRKTITWQLGIIIVCVIFISMVITSISNYLVSYEHTYEAAGIEAVGCANITTGLIQPDDLEKIIKGDEKKLRELQETLNWTTAHKQIFESQYVLLLDGTVLAADKNMQKQGYTAGDSFYIDKEALEIIKETKHPHYSEIYEYGGMKRVTGYAPIFKDHDPNKEIIALNAIDFNAKIVSERTWNSVKGSFILGLLPMVIASIITIWLIRRKTKPISILIDSAKKIADGDLSDEDILIKNKDEIGELSTTLSHMKNNLRELIHQVHTGSKQVTASSDELTASAEQTNIATEQITFTMHQMAASVDKQVQNVEDTSQTITDISNGVQQIAANAQNVTITAIGASEKATEGVQAIKTAVQQMDSINETVNELAGVVIGLGDRSKAIGEIIGTITGIAEQTNLLALNAAIEAARAGEHGSGFAVVADEVRKLAEQSAQSAQEISQLISTTQHDTNKAVESMAFVTKEVVEGIEIVNNAGNSFVHIQDSVNEVTNQIQEVSSAVQQMAAGAEQAVQSMKFIVELADITSSSTQSVSTATEEQLASMHEITSSAKYLSRMADDLQAQIGKFTI